MTSACAGAAWAAEPFARRWGGVAMDFVWRRLARYDGRVAKYAMPAPGVPSAVHSEVTPAMHNDKLDLRTISLVCVETRYPELASFAI